MKLYTLILKEIGFGIVKTANNGKEAIKKFKSDSENPDLIIMDYRMPIMNGIDTMIQILEIEERTKIIFASADDSIKESALSKGAISFLKKPFDIEDLQKIISNVLADNKEDVKLII